MPKMNLAQAINVDINATFSDNIKNRVDRIVRETDSIELDDFLEIGVKEDYRNYDFSSLTGRDTSERKENGLTKSEEDALKFFMQLALLDNETKVIKNNYEEFIRMQALLTPVEKYKQIINRDYLLAARNPVANNVKWKNGYDSHWKQDNAKVEAFNENKNDYTSTTVKEAEAMETMHQIYSYRMAMVNGEPNPPEPVIKFKIPARWNVQYISNLNQQINDGASPTDDNFKKDATALNNMYQAAFGHFSDSLDAESKNEPLKEFDNIFIDGVSVREKCNALADGKSDEAKRIIYQSTVMNAMLKGEHFVETGVRYMNKNGQMDMKYFAVEPDLTVVANAERQRHSWFRRLFDFGPFKISTCKTKAANRRSADSTRKREGRHNEIDRKYNVKASTVSNPNTIVFPKNDNIYSHIKTSVRGVQKEKFDTWLKNICQDEITGVGSNRYNSFFKSMTVGKGEWGLGKAFVNAIDATGIENAVDLFGKLDKLNPTISPYSATKKARSIFNNLPEDYEPKITPEEAFNEVMDYYFKNGSTENPNSTMILALADSVAQSEEQRQFITTLKSFDTGKQEYFTSLQAVAEMAHKDQYENVQKVPEELSNKVQEGQVKIKLNRFLCDTVSSQLKDKKFDGSILNGTAAKALNELAANSDTQYKVLYKNVLEGAKKDFHKDIKCVDLMKEVYDNINKIPGNVKDAIKNVIRNDKQVDIDLNAYKHLVNEAKPEPVSVSM